MVSNQCALLGLWNDVPKEEKQSVFYYYNIKTYNGEFQETIQFEVFSNGVKSGGISITFQDDFQAYQLENCEAQNFTQATLNGHENNWLITNIGNSLSIYCNGQLLKEVDLRSCEDGYRWENANKIQFTEIDTASIKFSGKKLLKVRQKCISVENFA
jgi:hypothetical protein